MVDYTPPQPTNWRLTAGGRYESECPSCLTALVKYHRDAPSDQLASLVAENSGLYNCPTCDVRLYVNRVHTPGYPAGKIL